MKTKKSKLIILIITAAALIALVPVLNGYQSPDPLIPTNPNLSGQRIRAMLTVYYASSVQSNSSCEGQLFDMSFALWIRDTDELITYTDTAVCDAIEDLAPAQAALDNFMDVVYAELCETASGGCTGGITSFIDGVAQFNADTRAVMADIRFVVNEP